jgi:hypothetical protein
MKNTTRALNNVLTDLNELWPETSPMSQDEPVKATEKTSIILNLLAVGALQPDLTLELYLHPVTGHLVATQTDQLSLRPADGSEKVKNEPPTRA